MTWKDKMAEFGGGDVAFLSEDGEMITFIVIADPFLIEGKYRGTDTERIACPVVTEDGFSLLVVGKRAARRISKHEERFKDSAFVLIRHGEQGDTKTTYELKGCDDPGLTESLFKSAQGVDFTEDIKAAVEQAKEIAIT